jgi:rubrerythrin
MTKTEEDLKAAFAGESQANRKYLAFAAQAEKDGFKQVAKLFRAAAEAETVHALNHLNVLGGVKSTAENLKAAMEGEKYEYTQMYPGFLKDAIADKNAGAQKTFGGANKVEEVHYGLYDTAAKAVATKKDLDAKPIYVCPICGDTFVGEAPAKCPVCGCEKAKFKKIE